MTPIIRDTDYIISDVNVSHVVPNFYTESINFIGNAKSRGLHRLSVEFKVTLVDENDIRKFQALMLKIRGRLNPFKLSLLDSTDGKGYCNPFYLNNRAMLTSGIKVGNNKMVLSGISGEIPAGTMFHFPNDSKTYVLLDDARSNKSVEFFPATKQNQETKAPLDFSVEPLLRLEGDEFKIKYDKGAEYTFKAVEVL